MGIWHVALALNLVITGLIQAESGGGSARSDSAFLRWVRANAIPLPPVDRSTIDSSFAFLRPLVGSARILALGELIHGGHEPLEFRNQVIKYAVTQLGFTAIALETGFTEAAVVDGFIHGGGGNVDSVRHKGLTNNFDSLPENRELILWLRSYNAHAVRPVRFYGVDLSGGNDYGDIFDAAPPTVAALDYLQQVNAGAAAQLRVGFHTLLGHFNLRRFGELSPAQRHRLQTELESLAQTLLADSSHDTKASLRAPYDRVVHDVWMAFRMYEVFDAGVGGAGQFSSAQAELRDSIMAENAKWILGQEGEFGRLLLYEHDAHVMNGVSDFTHVHIPGASGLGKWKMAGRHLRGMFGPNLVIIATTASATKVLPFWVNGMRGSPSDPASFDAALARVGEPRFALDLRTADHIPDVAALLERPWPFRTQTFFEPVIVRDAADAIVYFDRVSPSRP